MPGEPPRAFFDTNTLLHLISADVVRADRINDRVAEGGHISVQVLNEFANVARKKHRLAVPQIRFLLDQIRLLVEVIPVTEAIHDTGLQLIERYGLSTYDAMIVAAALGVRCTVLYSEDMQHGMVVDGRLTIIDPFRDV